MVTLSVPVKNIILEIFVIVIVLLFLTGSIRPSLENSYTNTGLQSNVTGLNSIYAKSKFNQDSLHNFPSNNSGQQANQKSYLERNAFSPNSISKAYSIDPLNDSVLNGFGKVMQGINIPYRMTFSNNGNYAFISDFLSAITIINLSTYKIVKTISIGGSFAGEPIYVPATNSLYVSNGSVVDIINASSFSIYSSINVKGIFLMTYDINNSNIFAVSSNNNFSIIYDINTSTDSVVPLCNLTGGYIDDIIYESSTKDIYFAISENQGYYIGLFNTTNKYNYTAKVSNSSYEGSELGNSLTYNPFTKTIYLALLNKIDVINGSNLILIGNFSTVTSPLLFSSVVYDNLNDNLYYINGINISRVNISTYKFINITTDPTSTEVAYNRVNGNIYVIDYLGKFEKINAVNGSTERMIQLSDQVNALSYDTKNNDLYVSSISPDKVSVMNTQTNQFVTNISIPVPKYSISLGGPIVYDPFENTIFMENIIIDFNSNDNGLVLTQLLRINATTNNVTQTVNLNGGAGSIFLNSNNKILYITSLTTDSIELINTSNNDTITYVNIGHRSFGLSYDSNENVMLVSTAHGIDFLNETSNKITRTISLENGSIALAYNSAKNYIYSENLYNATWYIPIINATNGKIVGKLVTGNYILPSIATISNGNFIFVNNIFALNISVFTAVGCKTHTFSLIKSELLNISLPFFLALPLGNDQVIFDSSNNLTYASNPFTGYIYVFPLQILSNAYYTVTFNENNLPGASKWYVNLSNGQSFSSTSDTISFSETNRSYSYTVATSNKIYSPSPSSGSFTVNGSSLSKLVVFSLVKYTVTFKESGLPSGTAWYVNLSNAIDSGAITGTSYSFSLTNGTYSYSISNPSGYTVSPSSGSITVNGSNVPVSTTFTPVKTSVSKYTITFSESGLPFGTSWSVTLNGAPESSTSGTITFTEPNGTYSYTVSSVSGYTVSPSSGSIVVSGNSISKAVTFTATSPNKTPPSGISNTELYGIVGVVVTIAVIASAVGLIRRRK